jgi:hypothetical protein
VKTLQEFLYRGTAGIQDPSNKISSNKKGGKNFRPFFIYLFGVIEPPNFNNRYLPRLGLLKK